MEKETFIEPTLLFSVMCDDVRREDNGKFMLIGLFETVGSLVFPAVHPTLFIVNCWTSGLGSFRQKTRILAPDGKVLLEDKETEFILKDLKAKHKVIARFNNIKFIIPGEYSVEVILNSNLKVRYPLVAKQISPPSPA